MSPVMPKVKAPEAYSIPLSEFDVSNPKLFQDNTVEAYFARLRAEDPVHYCPQSRFGSYWSVTKYRDIVSVDSNHKVYSSEASLGGPTLIDGRESFQRDRFMAMDPPKHAEQRKVIAPVVGPGNLAMMEGVIRERAGTILDGLPINVTFDWVDRVSIELTTQMLATLFGFPWEDRRMLARWSNVAMAIPESGIVSSEAAREAEIMECYHYFKNLWDQRAKLPPQNDFISAMVHSVTMRDMPMNEFIGNIILLIVGGNDTTRNSISGGVLALNENPSEYDKLHRNHQLIGSMVSEVIRWQTPLAHMKRTAVQDTELGGKTIRKGDKVVMWYLSGNRDEEAIENANKFLIDRKNARQHLSFGFGIHRCLGNRLAEMQLRVLWEEILKRFPFIEVVGRPTRTYSNFIHGFESLLVRLPKRF
jgi:cytochrome P450